MEPVSRLFEPIILGGVTDVPVQHRGRSANDWHLQHLGSLSLSGAGLLVIEQTAVEPAGRISHGCLGLYPDQNEAALPVRSPYAAAGASPGSASSWRMPGVVPPTT